MRAAKRLSQAMMYVLSLVVSEPTGVVSVVAVSLVSAGGVCVGAVSASGVPSDAEPVSPAVSRPPSLPASEPQAARQTRASAASWARMAISSAWGGGERNPFGMMVASR